MSLKILKQNEPLRIDRLVMCVYGPPGVGKSSFGNTADKPLTFDFDKGAHRAKNRKDIVQVSGWNEVSNITAEDLAPYSTIIVDTAGRALDALTIQLIKENPKNGRGDGSLTLPGFGALKVRFSNWLTMLKSFGKDVVLLAHMDEQGRGDEVIERLDVQGGSKGEIYKSVDAMGRIFVREQGNPKQIIRHVDFSPRENSFGKNPCNLDVMPFPNPETHPDSLAELIERIKTRLNQQTAEQEKAADELADWTLAIQSYTTVEEFNKNLPAIKKAPTSVQLFASKQAKEKGFVYDPKKMMFVEKAQPANAA